MQLLLVLLAAAPMLEYRVTASPGAEVLDVQVTNTSRQALSLDEPLMPYVSPTDGGYRFRLKDAANELQSRRWAFADGPGLYAAPSSWLMRPAIAPEGARFTLRVDTPKGISFVTGLHRASAPNLYEGPVWALSDAPWSGFAPLSHRARLSLSCLVLVRPESHGSRWSPLLPRRTAELRSA